MLKSPAIIASGISIIFQPENPFEICDRIKILLQGKHAGNTSDIINEEFFAIADKLSKYKCISTKQHEILLVENLN